MKKIVSTLLLTLGVQICFPLSVALAVYNSGTAQSYLANHSDNPWSTMGLNALGASSIPSDYLKSINGTSAIEYAAPILAITALNQNPRTFGNKDYVAELKKYHTDGQIGDTSTINDDIFGLLALVAAGEPSSDSAVADAKSFISSHQQSNGGWGFATSGGTDSNMTSAAIVALIASGTPSLDSTIQNGLDYLKTSQNDDGGFTYDPTSTFGKDSDSSSTAWVMWALNATGINPADWSKSGHSPIGYLESNQAATGYFSYQTGGAEDTFSANTTAYAVIALSGKTLPLNKITSDVSDPTSTSPKFDFRIEGKNNTVCSGQTAGPTALDIVKNASAQCGFTFNIKQTSFGSYLDQINDDTATGVVGWLYRINYLSPPVGASEYTLKSGDSVLWYFSDFNWKPTRLSLSKTQIDSGGSVTATVESFDETAWTPLNGAKVLLGTTSATSDNSGHVTITNADGFYKVFAEKDGYIRSNAILLQIGNATPTDIVLSVNIKKGTVDGATIAFIVDPSNFDFGTLKPGDNKSQNFSIKNTGTVNVNVQSIVKGDDVFSSNITLDSKKWQDFKKSVTVNQSQPATVTLTIPSTYSGSEGIKKGTITFWATGA